MTKQTSGDPRFIRTTRAPPAAGSAGLRCATQDPATIDRTTGGGNADRADYSLAHRSVCADSGGRCREPDCQHSRTVDDSVPGSGANLDRTERRVAKVCERHPARRRPAGPRYCGPRQTALDYAGGMKGCDMAWNGANASQRSAWAVSAGHASWEDRAGWASRKKRIAQATVISAWPMADPNQ